MDWSAHVQTSRSDLARLAEPVALLNFRLRVPLGAGGDAEGSRRDVATEFTRPQLVSFLRRLDLMQAQLDALGA